MNRLQKKCLVTSALLHVLLLGLVFVGSAFIPAKQKEEFVSLDMVDLHAMVVDEPNVVGGGNPNAGMPPSSATVAPPVTPLPPPAAAPKAAEPVKEMPKETPKEPPHEKEKVEKVDKAEKAPEKLPRPEPKPKEREHAPDPDAFDIENKLIHKEKPARTEPAFDLRKAEKRVIKPGPHVKDNSNAQDDARAQNQKDALQAENARTRAGAVAEAMNRLQSGLSKGVGEIGIPGPGGQAYASYGLVLRKIYEDAWIPPNAARGDEPVVEVEVVIARDGTVLSGRVTKKAGRMDLDRSVQRVLDRVKKVPAFPSGSVDEKRMFHIHFNLTDKLNLG